MTDAPDARAEPEPPPAAAPVAPAAPPRWGAGRIAMLAAGGLAGLVGLVVLATGAYGLWLHTTQRTDGYVMTSSERFTTSTYALATRTLHVSSDVPDFLYGRDWLGDVRISGASATPGRPIFIGIAHKADVDRYLAGVAHAEVVDIDGEPFGNGYRPAYRPVPGGRPARPPTRAAFWVARAQGPGDQALTWRVKAGRWSVVVMRPDGSRGVSADLAAGAKLPALLWTSLIAVAIGLFLLGAAGALIYFGSRDPRLPAPAAT